MPRGVNYPLFVPSTLADVRRLIEGRRSKEAVELLNLKAKFANHPAAALLAFIHLKRAAPQEEFPIAITQCKAAAAAADPFAEFVLAQIHLTAGNTLEGLAWMRKSSNHLFPPALSHMGRMMARGEGYPIADARSAFQMYRMAIGYGHVPTIMLAAKLLLASRNPLKCFVGILLFPLAFIAAVTFFRLAPFDVRGFVHVPGDGGPLFDSPQ